MGQTFQLGNAAPPPVDTGMHFPATERDAPMRLLLRRLVRDPFVIVLVALAVLAGAWLVLKAYFESQSESAPDSISQTELVDEYLDLVPDRDATSGGIVKLANTTCDRLSGGVSVDDLVSSTAEVYGDARRAKQVLRLLVSYGCPGHLDDF